MLSLIPPDDVRLRRRSERIRKVRPFHRRFAEELLDLMRAQNGIGIAAPQVGHLRRICIVRPSNELPRVMVDPEIIVASDEMVTFEEGCLSFPGRTFPVKRHAHIVVQYTDLGNVSRLGHFEGLAAICAQHEIDHLDGVLAHMRAADGVAP